MVMGSRDTTALEPNGVFSSTSISMARSPSPTLSASSLTIDAISPASYSTRWNSSGETVTDATSGSLAVAGGGRLKIAEGAGPGDAACLDHDRLERTGPSGGPVDVRRSADQRLEHHLAVAPVFDLILEDELQPPDRR